ncbi:MAG: hypothetical protein ACRD3E_07545 [Terriglobales bacterium]
MRYLLAIAAISASMALNAAPAAAQAQYPGSYAQPQGWHGVLSAQDQQQFDQDYSKWVDATQRQDRDDIAKNAKHMQEIMSRYNIPAGVSFDQVASAPAGATVYPNQAYPNQAYPVAAPARLSPDDQQKFDKEYQKWLDAQRKADRDDIDEHARNMEQIMARYNIPSTVAFQSIAAGAGVVVPNAAYPGTACPYVAPMQRLSADDQKDFDKAYKNWVKAERKRDMDDVNGNATKMRNIMARYNIPANVPFDAIATPGTH